MENRELRIKQGIAWGISIGVAFALSLFTVYVPLGTDLDTYTIKYFVLTVISFACFFVIWLDYLLDAKILPD
jgi:hypothetical protein